MSDRWDAEVWLYETAGPLAAYTDGPDPNDPPEKWCRYIRTDMYEQVEAERDRLRAALEGIRDMPYSSRKPHTVFDASARAQEALDHG